MTSTSFKPNKCSRNEQPTCVLHWRPPLPCCCLPAHYTASDKTHANKRTNTRRIITPALRRDHYSTLGPCTSRRCHLHSKGQHDEVPPSRQRTRSVTGRRYTHVISCHRLQGGGGYSRLGHVRMWIIDHGRPLGDEALAPHEQLSANSQIPRSVLPKGGSKRFFYPTDRKCPATSYRLIPLPPFVLLFHDSNTSPSLLGGGGYFFLWYRRGVRLYTSRATPTRAEQNSPHPPPQWWGKSTAPHREKKSLHMVELNDQVVENRSVELQRP